MKGFINLLNARYAIEQGYARKMAAMAYLVVNKKVKLSARLFEVEAKRSEVLERETIGEFGDKTQSRVAIMHINGPLFRDDQWCGPRGMLSMAEELKGYNADSEIDAIVLNIYSPGGQVHGLEAIANAVAESEKPVVVHTEMAASAAYHIAVGAWHIMLSGKNASVGSIGTQFGYYDFTEALEKEGIHYVQITASTSPDKNAHNFDNPTEEDKLAIATDILDPLDANFMAHVQEHRPDIDESTLTGKMYYAEQAIELNMADSIGTFEDAIELALEMAGKSSNQKAMDDNQANAQEQKPDIGLQAQLTAAQQTIETKDALIKAQNQLIAQNNATIEAQNSRIEQLQAEVDRLGQLPAEDPDAAPVASGDDASNQIEDLKETKEVDPITEEAHKMILAGQQARKRKAQKEKV